MIEKLKKQSFNRFILPIILLFIFLIGIFVFTTFYATEYFIFLFIGFFIVTGYLISLRAFVIKKNSEFELKDQYLQEKINLIEAEISNEEKMINSFKNKIVSYSQLKGLTERLSMSLYLEETSKTFSGEINNLFGKDNTTIILYLFHSKTGELGISSSHKGQMRINLKAKKGDLFDQWVVKAMQPLLIEDTKSDYRFDMDKLKTEDSRSIRSLISVPLMVGNKALGILRIDSPRERFFITEDLRFLTTIGGLGSVAIENAQLYERVEALAIRDGLTKLYLRRYLVDRIPEEISRHLRRKSPLSFIMVDLDHFKKYNDKFGHIAGDIVLRTVSTILLEDFNQPGTLVCRYGGEEFSVLLPNCKKEDAINMAQKFRERVAKEIISLRRKKTKITVSVGVSTFPKDAQTKEELIHKADLALYKAKKGGRNQVFGS